MTTDKTALRALADAVERGLSYPTSWRSFAALPEGDPEDPNTILAHRAYHGDMNAALRMVETLLPGWGWAAEQGEAAVWHPDTRGVSRDISVNAITSRAMLLAVLRAKIEGEG